MKRFFLNGLFVLLLLISSPCWGAITFDAIDDFVDAGSASDLDDVLPATFSFWAQPGNAHEGDDGRWFDKTEGANSGYVLIPTNDGDVVFFQSGTTTFFLCTTNVSGVFTVDAWNHIALTWDGSVDSTCSTVDLYVNGSLVSWDTTQGSGARPTDASNSFMIGNKNTGGDNTYDGDLENFAIYDKVLTTSQIADLAANQTMTAPLQFENANLLRNWRFDDVADGTSADGVAFIDMKQNGTATANDGANNTGMTGKEGKINTYP